MWRRAQAFFAATFLLGGAVLAAGAATGRVPLSTAAHPVQIGCQLVAATGLGGLWLARRRDARWWMRLAVGGQVLAILIGWFHGQAPTLLRTAECAMTLKDAAVPFITQLWLAIGLTAVVGLVVPLLVWLYRVFDAARSS